MSKEIQHSERFAEVEYCLQSYFDTHFVSVMRSVKDFLGKKQAEEIGEYALSPAGLLGSFAAGATGMPDNTLQYLRLTGEWNSKTAEDYVEMCRERIAGNKEFTSDLALLAHEWREAVVAEIGREQYDKLSARLGGDLAYAYVDYRVEQMMVDRMVKEQMPKSSVEYVLRKGMEGSLFGFADSLMRSPLQQEIDARGEAAYNPSTGEKWAGRGVSLAADAVATGGIASWAALAGTVGLEAASYGVEWYIEGKENAGKKPPTVEDCISRAVFGAEDNVFTGFRKQGNKILSYENDYVLSVNSQLAKPMGILTERPVWADWMEQNTLPDFPSLQSMFPEIFEDKRNDERYKNMPLVVAPGHEEEYLAEQQALQEEPKGINSLNPLSTDGQAPTSDSQGPTSDEPQMPQSPRQTRQPDQQPSNENGWDGLLRTFGLDGIGGVGRNLGYVVSMLPDVLIGLFTGHTKSFGVKDSLLPIASILLGMFVRNPLLKMVLIGMGGLNLLNKAGQEALDRQEETSAKQLYKPYPDEPLNARLAHPVLQGDNLFMDIDGVPCSILLPYHTAEACREGALPINTLANAVLAKHEETRQMTQENYRASEQTLEEGRERTFGIK